MQIEVTTKTKPHHYQVKLSDDLNDFVQQKSKELNCNRSEAIRAIINACRLNSENGGQK